MQEENQEATEESELTEKVTEESGEMEEGGED